MSRPVRCLALSAALAAGLSLPAAEQGESENAQRAERRAAWHRSVLKWLKEADADADSALDAQESQVFKDHHPVIFDREFDIDKDGQLSQDEYAHAVEFARKGTGEPRKKPASKKKKAKPVEDEAAE